MAASLMSPSSCVLEPLVQSMEFKSGAVYRGDLLGGKRSGRGTFSWPSGLQYTGEFSGDKRHGYGVQLWSDGSKYEGEFREDLRHGKGRHVWSNGEVRVWCTASYVAPEAAQGGNSLVMFQP